MAFRVRVLGVLTCPHGVTAARVHATPTTIMRGFPCRSSPVSNSAVSASLPTRLSLRLRWHSTITRDIASRCMQRRAYSSAKANEAATDGASAAAAAVPGKQNMRMAFPQRLVIYHAGTGKNTFLAIIKVTALLVFIVYGFLLTPSYIMNAAPLDSTLGVLLCGTVPLLVVTWTASPFVTAIHLHLPPFARKSSDMLRRFAASVPPTTRLDIVTQSIIGKPRISSMTVGDLKPTNKRFGMVNYERDTAQPNKERKWYHFRAIGNFNVQHGNEGNLKNGWVWPEVAKTIARRAEGNP